MEEPERLEPRPMSAFAAVGWTLGVTVVFILLAQLFASLRPDAKNLDLVTAAGCEAAAYLLALFLVLRVHAPEASIRNFVALRGTHSLFYAVAPLLAVTVKAFTDVIHRFILQHFPSGQEGVVDQMILGASPGGRAAILVALVLVVPAVEELFFRGALVQALRKSNPLPVVAGVVAVTFALAHQNTQAFLPLLLCGAAVVILRLASGSLIPGFLFHVTFNGVGFLEVLRAQAHGDEEERYRLPLFALGILGTVILLALMRAISRTTAARAARLLDGVA